MKTKPTYIEKHVNDASELTRFEPTYFEIYDKSTNDELCDRLIIVQPFSWVIWAKSGLVYILEDTNLECPANYTPGTLVPNDVKVGDDSTTYNFKSVCINNLLENIISSYTSNIIPIKEHFSIEDLQSVPDKFTILDALNYLFTKYITMDSPEVIESYKKNNRKLEPFLEIINGPHHSSKKLILSKQVKSVKQQDLIAATERIWAQRRSAATT